MSTESVLCWGSLNVNIDTTAVGQEGSGIADTGAADWWGTDLETHDRWFLPFRKPYGGWVFVDTGRSSIVNNHIWLGSIPLQMEDFSTQIHNFVMYELNKSPWVDL